MLTKAESTIKLLAGGVFFLSLAFNPSLVSSEGTQVQTCTRQAETVPCNAGDSYCGSEVYPDGTVLFYFGKGVVVTPE